MAKMWPTVSFTSRIPSVSSFTKRKKGAFGNQWLWWLLGAGIVAVVLILIFRPQWLLGLAARPLGNAGAAAGLAIGAVANPLGWV